MSLTIDARIPQRTARERSWWERMNIGCINNNLARLRPRYHRYPRWQPLLKIFLLIVILCCVFNFILARHFQNLIDILSPKTTYYRLRNVQVPKYLSLEVGENGQSKCKPIFESIVPHNLRQNVSEKELHHSLFGKKINLAYAIQSDSNERIPIMKGKLCSNSSLEWMLLTILEKESPQKLISESMETIENVLDASPKAHECVSFDLEKCSLNNLGNGYPKVFQMDSEQLIKRVSVNRRGSIDSETILNLYFYTRRKAEDFVRYKRQLTSIDSASANMTIIPKLITPEEIRITVNMTQTNASFANMDCRANLKREDSNPICSFPIVNATIQFDRLSPSTNYDVCIECERITIICKQFKTKQESSFKQKFSIPSDERGSPSFSVSSPISRYLYVVLIVIILVLFLIIAIVLSHPYISKLFGPIPCLRPKVRARTDHYNHTIEFYRASNKNDNNGGVRSGHDSTQLLGVSSTLTLSGVSVQDQGSSVSSPESDNINP